VSINASQCALQVKCNTLQHVKKFKHLGAAFTRDRRQDINTRVGKTHAVLHEFHHSMVTKQELQAQQSCHFEKLIFVPISPMVMDLD